MYPKYTLQQIVEIAFARALTNPTYMRWKSAGVCAGAAAIKMAQEENLFMACMYDGVAAEAHKRAADMLPQHKEAA